MPGSIDPEDGGRYEDLLYSGLDLRGVTLAEAVFSGCRFERCTLSGATLYRCSLLDCAFDDCDLSNLQVPNSRFVDAAFRRCKLLGVDWTRAGDRTASKLPLSFAFEECVLSLSGFFGLSLKNSRLLRCTALEADFAEADLSGCDCRETDFAKARFLHTNLSKADFTGARNYQIDPTANTVRRARFSLPDAIALLQAFDLQIS